MLRYLTPDSVFGKERDLTTKYPSPVTIESKTDGKLL